MRTFGQTTDAEENSGGGPGTAPDMDGRFYQTVTAVPAIVLEENPKAADVKRSAYYLYRPINVRIIGRNENDRVRINVNSEPVTTYTR